MNLKWSASANIPYLEGKAELILRTSDALMRIGDNGLTGKSLSPSPISSVLSLPCAQLYKEVAPHKGEVWGKESL